MSERIDYQIEKYRFSMVDENPRLTQQWMEVTEECRQQRAPAEERLRLALLNVDYITSFELPFRLMLTRAPQLIAALRDEFRIGQKNVIFNGKRFGCVYSLKADLSQIPDVFQYHLTTRIQRISPSGVSALPFQQIAKAEKKPRERLRLALESHLEVTALDALYWLGSQRIAADIAALRKSGMPIATAETDVYDSYTGTQRRIPVYRLTQ